MKRNTAVVGLVVKNDPHIAINLLKSFIKIGKAKAIDYNMYNGKSKEIPLVTLKITPKCNLSCKMCGQNGAKGTLKPFQDAEEDKLVPIERYYKFTDELTDKTKVFYIWGGEPFLYPNFMDLAAYITKKIPAMVVNTNGTWLAQNAERIVRDQWSGILISLDGFEDVNDNIRGKGVYQRVITGIDAINEEKKKQGSSLPYMGVVTTVSNMNYLYLDQIVDALAKKNLSWHVINLGTYITEEIGQEHVQAFNQALGVEPKYWKGFTTGYNEGIDGEKFEKILSRVHAIPTGYPVITVPVIRPKKIGQYYSDLHVLCRDQCMAPWISINVNYDGEVYFCADYPDYSIGNILNHSVTDIYNSERAVQFRNALRNQPNGLFPGCKRCYQINLFGHRRRGY